MANAEQLKILKQGVDSWNQWREEHPDQEIDLSGADCNTMKLSGVNFRRANLNGANLREAQLFDAHFAWASLQGADLSNAFLKKSNCYHADFRRIDLCRAVIQQANLSGINLQGADLTNVDFRATILSKANFCNALMTGAKLYATARDDWEIGNISCNHIYWDRDGKKRTPPDRDFRPGEFEELYKHLPTFDYVFEHGFTPIDAVVMDRVVQEINARHPEFELTLDSFQSRGQPHAKFTVLHKKNAESAQKAVREDYEARFKQLEGDMSRMQWALNQLADRPQVVINQLQQGDITMSAEKQIIGDNFESGGGAMNIAKDHGTATQTNYTIESVGSPDELLKLLDTVRQELAALPVDESVKEEVLNEVKGAEIQAKKPEADKQKIAAKLKDATAALEESAKTVKGAVTIGNLLGQAILWCGENWTIWA